MNQRKSMAIQKAQNANGTEATPVIFRVDINRANWEKEYEVGCRSACSTKSFHVRNKMTRQACVLEKVAKLECPVTDPQRILELLEKLQRLDHPNICRLYEAFDTPSDLALIYQRIGAGDDVRSVGASNTLMDQIQKKGGITEKRAAEICWHLVRAISAGEKDGLSHGSLTPKHMLEDSVGHIVVTNMGLVGILKQDPIHKVDKDNLAYISPEVVKPWWEIQDEIEKGKKIVFKPLPVEQRIVHSVASDLWSVGVVLYQLLSGKLPFQGKNLVDTASNILFDPPDYETHLAGVSKDAVRLIRSLLDKNPRNRPTLNDLLNDCWMHDRHHQDLKDEAMGRDVLTDLLSVHKETKFKKLMMHLIAEKLSPSKTKKLEEEFNKVDDNGDGYLTLKELKDYVKSHPESDLRSRHGEIDSIFDELDTDGGGYISLNEFIIATLDTQQVVLNQALHTAFKSIDHGGDGAITKAELRKVVREMAHRQALGEEYIEELVKVIELEVHDKSITFEEFSALVREEGTGRQRLIIGHCCDWQNQCRKACNAAYAKHGWLLTS